MSDDTFEPVYRTVRLTKDEMAEQVEYFRAFHGHTPNDHGHTPNDCAPSDQEFVTVRFESHPVGADGKITPCKNCSTYEQARIPNPFYVAPTRNVKPRLRFLVMRRDEFRCRYCGARGGGEHGKLVVDHVVPVAAGGRTQLDNLVTACEWCNSGKAALPVRD